MPSRNYRITVKQTREYSATIAIRASSQDEADRLAIAAFGRAKWDCEDKGLWLGLSAPWNEHDSFDYEPEIDTSFRCVDCAKDTGETGEYYTVEDHVWAASGLEPHGGMLCLACLERRIRRPLTGQDFTAIYPSRSAWEQHIAARSGNADQVPEQFEMLVSLGKED